MSLLWMTLLELTEFMLTGEMTQDGGWSPEEQACDWRGGTFSHPTSKDWSGAGDGVQARGQ